MEQTQKHQTGPVPMIDKRTKEYKEAQNGHIQPMSTQIIEVGSVQLHGNLFFGGKNFKEKIDVRTDKCKGGAPLKMEYSRETKELTFKGEGHLMHLPSTSVFGYTPITMLPPKVTAFSGMGANTAINAQVSGPHDHVFAGAGQGQTGQGAKIK